MGKPIAPKVFAARVGVGRVTLSRIERRQVTRSAVFSRHAENGNIVREDRRIVFGHPLLAAVADGDAFLVAVVVMQSIGS